MSKSETNLHSEELSLILWELSDLNQVAEKLSTSDERHQEIDAEFILEYVFHINQERMID